MRTCVILEATSMSSQNGAMRPLGVAEVGNVLLLRESNPGVTPLRPKAMYPFVPTDTEV